MRNTVQKEMTFGGLQDKAALLNALTDTNRQFTRNELEAIIQNEFFNDENSLDSDLVNAAVSRIILLAGNTLNKDTLQQEREQMIHGVLKKILKPK